ncbi:MAG: glutamate--tRNA ligase [Candidatus Woesearchaeota archaeon]
MEDFVEKIALENACKYGGKANPKALIGSVIREYPDAKNNMQQVMQTIESVVSKVNALSNDEQVARLEELGGPQQKKQKSDELKDLDQAKHGNVVMRFAPSPSGPMHIGHAITGGLTALYVKKYGGKFILRIEDTNAQKIDSQAYDLLQEDAKWIFSQVDEVIIQSDRMKLYYDMAKDMLQNGSLYVDTSSVEEFAQCVEKQIDPESKKASPKEQLQRFEKMLDGTYKEGQAVVRFKGDMAHKNPAMRDFPLLRISEVVHPRQGKTYRVWPLMNFSVFVDDLHSGMTHVIRAKDHADNAKRQELLFAAVGKNPPVSYFTGRYKFTGLELSASKTREKIAKGEFTGWQDIRLPFLQPLKRRGYQAQAFLSYAKANGLSRVDKVVAAQEFFQTIDALNKRIIDPIAKRFFFVEKPVQLRIDIQQQVVLSILPEKTDGRVMNVDSLIFIEQADEHLLQKGVVRLADFVNIEQTTVISKTYDEYKSHKSKAGIIHWLPAQQDQLVTVHIHMPDASIKKGVGEKTISQCKVGDIVQFERFGFCRLDQIKDGVYNFWFGHK